MQNPLDIKFKNFNDSKGEIEQIVKDKVEKLNRLHNNVISCHVLIEEIQNEQHSGHAYHIRIDVNIPPHHEIVVTRDPKKGKKGNDHLSQIIRDAFDSTFRKVKEISDRQHKKVKAHSKEPQEHVPEEIADEEDLILDP